jgi:hypothetical protein
MKKFLILYTSSVPAHEQMAKATPEQAKAGMDAWMAWGKKAGSSIVDFGAPVGKGTRQTSTNAGASSSPVGGYAILQADSKESLQELLKGHPHFLAPGGAIEILEQLPMPGM